MSHPICECCQEEGRSGNDLCKLCRREDRAETAPPMFVWRASRATSPRGEAVVLMTLPSGAFTLLTFSETVEFLQHAPKLASAWDLDQTLDCWVRKGLEGYSVGLVPRVDDGQFVEFVLLSGEKIDFDHERGYLMGTESAKAFVDAHLRERGFLLEPSPRT